MTNQSKENTSMVATRIPPPACIRGMKVLDRSAFEKKLTVPVLDVPLKSLKKTTKLPLIKSKILKIPFYKVVVKEVQNSEEKLKKSKTILLQPGTKFSDVELQKIKAEETSIEVSEQEITLSYKNYNHNDILKEILHESGDTVRGYTQVGHIVHVNLKEIHLPFKNIIGQVLLDKIPNARTIVNKPGIIDSEFRNFQVELIAGDENFVANIVEYNCKFQFDFSKVFWNSRLSTEHRRISELASKEDVVFDMFAGVGPFAVPLAKKGCEVHANDLNPESFLWLNKNNKLNKTNIESYNMDGCQFIKTFLLPLLIRKSKNKSAPSSTDHKNSSIRVLMNLPKTAVEFLYVFSNLINSKTIESERLTVENVPPITVHVYTFAHEESTQTDFREMLETNLGKKLKSEISSHYVRNCAPTKGMFCLTAQLDHGILCEPTQTDQEEPEPKRAKIEA